MRITERIETKIAYKCDVLVCGGGYAVAAGTSAAGGKGEGDGMAGTTGRTGAVGGECQQRKRLDQNDAATAAAAGESYAKVEKGDQAEGDQSGSMEAA